MLSQNVSKITVSAPWSDPTVSFEGVHKTEAALPPKPEDGASGPPKSQPIGSEDEKTWELNPFPFPRYARTMIHRAKPVSRNSFGRIPSKKYLDQKSQLWPDP